MDGHGVAALDADYVARGGVERGYAMTIHKAQGLTVDGRWQSPDGTEQAGTVLVHAPGADNPALYVALSRHRDQVLLFGSRQELETAQDMHVHGQPRDDVDRLRRVAARLAEQAQTSATSADDRPVLDDLCVGPQRADGDRRGWGGADPKAVRRWRDRRSVARGEQRQEPDDVKGRLPPRRSERKRHDREERTTVIDRGTVR